VGSSAYDICPVHALVAEAERGFLGQVEILRQRISELERDLAELKAKQQ
jgi:hypothetical protein